MPVVVQREACSEQRVTIGRMVPEPIGESPLLAGSGLSDSALAAPKRPFAQRPLSGRLDGRVSTLSGHRSRERSPGKLRQASV
jgi:hypothetical protein